MDPAHLNKLFSISNWLFLIPCYCQNSIGDLWNTLVPTTGAVQNNHHHCRDSSDNKKLCLSNMATTGSPHLWRLPHHPLKWGRLPGVPNKDFTRSLDPPQEHLCQGFSQPSQATKGTPLDIIQRYSIHHHLYALPEANKRSPCLAWITCLHWRHDWLYPTRPQRRLSRCH